MSTLYFLIPDLETTRTVVGELRAGGVSDSAIGVVAKDTSLLEALPEPDIDEGSDVRPALVQGAAVGGATGLLAGLLAAAVPGGLVLGGAALAGLTLAGGAFGAWVSSLIGVSLPNREIAEFERALNHGSLLMIVHAEPERIEAIKQLVVDRHPQVAFGGQDRPEPPPV